MIELTITAPEEMARRDALMGRFLQAGVATLEGLSIYLGDRLGLYQALAEFGAATPAQLAGRTGTHERYVREWLEQQAVAGILDVEKATEPPARRYRLPVGHAEVLLAQNSLNYIMPQVRLGVRYANALGALQAAFRTGKGVPYAHYGADLQEVQSELGRPWYSALLGTAWLPSIADVHTRLQADPPARVADLACGAGWSSIAIARAYPNARVDGFDVDQPSITLARKNVTEAGLDGRVTFQVHDAARPINSGPYDLVTIFEALHDMARPVEALRTIRGMLAEGGAVIGADPPAPDIFTAPGSDEERLFYCISLLFCLPTGMAEQPSAGTGAVMRPATLRRYAQEAGFSDVEFLPLEAPFWRFYRLIP